MKSLYYWAGRQVHHPAASYIFTALVFIEAFFFMPSSTLLMIFSLENRKRTWLYATLATGASIAGAAAAYMLGLFLWDSVGRSIVYFVISPETFIKLVNYYTYYQTPAILITAFLPLPYKAITLTAGFCKLPFLPYLICCGIARGIRFYLLAGAIVYWGNALQQILDQYFYYLVLLGLGLLIVSGWLIH